MNSIFLRSIVITLIYILPLTSSAAELIGMGRKIPAPLFEKWGKHFQQSNPSVTIKYQHTSSADAIAQVQSGKADFAETDAPLIKKLLDKKGLSQFPYMFTAITPVINLPGVLPGQFQLTGKLLGDIFLGKITKWNDPLLVAINPRLQLPNEKIIVVHIASEQGGTYAFTNYLSNANQEWADKVGVGSELKWPLGLPVTNLNEMKELVKKTPYAIAYSEISFARNNNLNYAKLQNKQGNFAYPIVINIENAVKKIQWTKDNGFNENLLDMPGNDSWPIATASYIIIKKSSDNIEQRTALSDFLNWAMRLGGFDVASLDFLPVERSVYPLIRDILNETPLTIAGGTVVQVDQLKELQSTGATIIDTRNDNDYINGRIMGAKHVPYIEKSGKATNFNAHQDKFDISKLPPDKNINLIFYSSSESSWEAFKASAIAIKAGYKKVYWLRKGFTEWVQLGYPSES